MWALPLLVEPRHHARFVHLNRATLGRVEHASAHVLLFCAVCCGGAAPGETTADAAASAAAAPVSPSELVQLVVGFAGLSYLPSARWLAAHRAASTALTAAFSVREREQLELAYLVLAGQPPVAA